MDTKQCRYRHGDLRCAIGILIKDEYYKMALEGLSIRNSVVQNAVQKSVGRQLSGIEWEILRALQVIHDHRDVSEWETLIEEVRVVYGLEVYGLEVVYEA